MIKSKKDSKGFAVHKSGWTKVTPPKVIIFLGFLILSVALSLILKKTWPLYGLSVSLAIALLVLFEIFLLRFDYVVIYKDRILFHKGFIMKKEKKEVFTGIKLVTVEQTVMGRLLGYGEVQANLYGAGIVRIKGVKDPAYVAEYMESLIVVPTGNITHITVS